MSTSVQLVVRSHFALPWLRNALHLTAEGGAFLLGLQNSNARLYAGGQLSFPYALASQLSVYGYAPNSVVAPHIGIVTAQYTFPVVAQQRGLTAVPVFLTRLSGVISAQLAAIDLGVPLWSAGLALQQEVQLGFIHNLVARVGLFQGNPARGGETQLVFSIGPIA